MANENKSSRELVERIFGTTVPSEILEPHVTRITAILISEYAKDGCTDCGFKVILGQLRALGMLISELRATHCSLAFTNEVRSVFWRMEREPAFRKEIDAHFIEVYRKSIGL